MNDVIRLTRRATVEMEESLIEPINAVVQAIDAEGEFFHLSGYSPAFHLYPVEGDATRWVMTSEIEWNFGREPQDPTHQVVFFSTATEEERAVYLRVRWVLAGEESTRPGLDLLLRLDAEFEPLAADRAARLDRLFSKLVEAIRPDFGHVTLYDDSDESGVNEKPVAGWLTYLAGKSSLDVPSPAVATPLADGVKITLRPGPVPETADEIAEPLAAVQQAIAAG